MTKTLRLALGRGLLVTLFLSGAPGAVMAQVHDWTGEVSSDWFEPGNWNLGSVPTIDDAVQINTTSPNPTVADGAAAEVGVINIASTQTGHLSIVNGGTLTSGFDFANDLIGQVAGSEGTVVISGAGSAWTGDNLLFGRGTLTIEDGGALQYEVLRIAAASGAVAGAIVTGSGSQLIVTEELTVGDPGNGTLTLSHGSLVERTGGLVFVGGDGMESKEGTGTVNIGAAADEPPVPPGTLNAVGVEFGGASGTLNFNHAAPDYEFCPLLFGSGVVNVLAGTTRMTADADTFSGTTHVVGGTLRVEAELAGTLDVQPGGRLEGGAPSTVGATINAGTVATRGNTLNVAGDYVHAETGTLEVEIAPDVQIVQLNATGTADLRGGVLSVLMAPGDYPPGSSFPIITADEGITGTFDTLIQSDPIVPFELVQTGNVLFLVVPFDTEVFSPLALAVDPEPVISDGNQVFEPGERVDVIPTWENGDSIARELTGTAAGLTGPVGPTYTLVLDEADYGLVAPGTAASCLVTPMCYQMDIGPAGVPRPAPHWDAAFDETLSDETVKTWTLHIGNSFADVPREHPRYSAIETLLHRGSTSGCGGGAFCPANPTVRAHVAVFMLRAVEGIEYTPPPCVPDEERFADVPADHPYCPWIEELARRQITAGCGGGNYCPDGAVTRAAAAPLLLRTLEGADYTPPQCDGVFADVPCPSPLANWIEDLFARAITTGCGGGNYCPTATVTRASMAVFVTRTFGLVLYGP